MELIKLSKTEYQGKPLTVHYKTGGYYHIEVQEQGFLLTHRNFDTEQEKSFQDSFFGEWLEAPTGIGAFEDGRMVGYVEGSHERWNNRYRISNICVFGEGRRRSGIGGRLMEAILQTARECGARMAVLETQTCNERAIAFYQKCGFQIIGFDLFAYTNRDLERNEVRLEMGLML